jgi:ADP-ribose pyrophosphatase YjhB (NUDIX family)
MPQKYKIHINDVEIYLAQYTESFKLFPTNSKPFMVVDFEHIDKLDKLIHSLEIKMVKSNMLIVGKDLEKLRQRFMSLFNLVVAGGGIVENEHREILMIYRKGKWDLPKGKIEKDERKRDGAAREVEEETGVHVDQVKDKVIKTYHTYNLNHKRMLKETHWYHMLANGDQELIPQAEEDVEEVRWVSRESIEEYIGKSYNSIQEVMNKFL